MFLSLGRVSEKGDCICTLRCHEHLVTHKLVGFFKFSVIRKFVQKHSHYFGLEVNHRIRLAI